MNKTAILLLVLIFLNFFFVAVTKNVSAHSDVQIIEMTANGFSPDSVIVDQNATIIFINKDGEARWPASNIHPTHELYPEFDPKTPIKTGESWSFKPKKVGVWKYHDHLLPHFRGTIEVETESPQVQSETKAESLDQTSEKSSLWTALKNFFAKLNFSLLFRPTPKKELEKATFTGASSSEQLELLKKYSQDFGPERAWGFIKETYKGQAGSTGNIHDLAHLSGNLLFSQIGFDGLNLCSSEFSFGCYHGFLDTAFAKNLDHMDEAHDTCLKLGSGATITGPSASCLHGIGHGVASFYSTSDIEKALSSCRKLITGSEYCFDGVFMEFVRSAPESFFKKDDPLYPCSSLEKKYGYAYSSACGRNQPTLLMSRFRFGFNESTEVCLNSDSKPFKESCIDALGFSLAANPDSETIILNCQEIGQIEFVDRCLRSAAGELVFQETPAWDQKSKAICQNSSQPDECLEYVNRLIVDYKRIRK